MAGRPTNRQRTFQTTSERILRSINKSEVTDLAKCLIAFDTTNPPGNELPCAKFLISVMRRMGLKTTIQRIDPRRGNAIGYTTPLLQGPTLLLEGHIDTAPIGTAERKLWTVDPFSARLRSGRIFGKGIVDMKGGLVASLTAVQAVLRSGIHLKGNIKVAALADEEGYMRGVKRFIESGYARDVDACISTEPLWGVQIAQGGRTWGRITVKGRSTTSGVDPDYAFKAGVGNNAIHQAASFLSELKKHRPSHGVERLFRRSWWHVLKIQGGWDPENAPMCPESCEIILEGRLVPGHTIDAFWKDVSNLIVNLRNRSPGFNATVDVLERRPAYSTRRNDPIVKAVIGAYARVIGKKPQINPFRYPMNSTTDAHYLAAEGIPCVTIGPVEPNNILAKQMFIANESVSARRIVDTARILAVAILRYLT